MGNKRRLMRGIEQAAVQRTHASIAKRKANKELQAKVGDGSVKVPVGGTFGYGVKLGRK